MSTRPDKRTPARKTSKPAQSPSHRDWLAEFAEKAALDDKALLSVRDWLAEQFIGDEYAQLGHAGHRDTQVPLRQANRVYLLSSLVHKLDFFQNFRLQLQQIQHLTLIMKTDVDSMVFV
jgi:hypothetical protein